MKELYLELLKISYQKALEHQFDREHPKTKLAYLADEIFDFTTYDDSMSELFAAKAIEVCVAISDQRTFEYIATEEGNLWYLLMVNMPFFVDKIEWGTSIRGAWWDIPEDLNLESCGLYTGNDEQILTLPLTADDWKSFVAAMSEFSQ